MRRILFLYTSSRLFRLRPCHSREIYNATGPKQSLEQAHETLHFFCDDRDTLPPSHASSSRPQLAHLRVRFIGLNSIFEGRPTNSCIDHISPMLTPLGLLLAFTASIHALDTLTITSLLTTIPSGYTTTNLTTTFALSPITLTSALAPITCSTSFLPTKAPTSFLPCSNPAYAFRFTDPAATACGFEMEIAVTVPLATTGSGTGETVTLAKVLADQVGCALGQGVGGGFSCATGGSGAQSCALGEGGTLLAGVTGTKFGRLLRA